MTALATITSFAVEELCRDLRLALRDLFGFDGKAKRDGEAKRDSPAPHPLLER